jgi:serine/threonine-protein kinase
MVTVGLANGREGATPPAQESTLAWLSQTIGPVPHILLRDTLGPEGKLVLPGSPERPIGQGDSGRYQLLGEIARGGMGAVLKGHDTDLGRDLAFKVLLEQHRENPEMVRRFVEEAQIGGQLQHPGVVPVYELGQFPDRRPYFTMKLVKGRTLAALLQERQGPADDRPRLLGIFAQVCQTVAYAHARGVIHRDLKPSNVMVGSFGEVQVMDWGLAKVREQGGVADEERAQREKAAASASVSVIRTVRSGSQADESQAGSVLGTPAYMAPEQANGELEHVDERADVFGLGSILCEILTGQPAYTGRTPQEVFRKAARGDLAEASARLDACGADPELCALARRCLTSEPEDRPRDAGEVASTLTAYLAGVQQRLRMAELAHAEAEARAAEARKRCWLTMALAASVLGSVLLVGGGWAWVVRERAERAATFSRQVNAALVEANQRRGQDNLAGAIAAAKGAEALLLTQGGGDAEMRGRVQSLLADLVAQETDRRMIGRLDQIRKMVGNDLDRPRVDLAYAVAFREYGIDIDTLAPAEAAARIAARPIAVTLAAALDHWTFTRRAMSPAGSAGARRLATIAAASDPDPWRNRLRDALGREKGPDRETLRKLAADLDTANQTTQAVSRLAYALRSRGDVEKATSLMRDLQRLHPDDFWVNCDLATDLLSVSPPRIGEALCFLTAAVSLSPRSAYAHNFLGIAYLESGETEKAIGEYREALRVSPNFPAAHYNLGQVLASRGELDAAIVEYRAALEIIPDAIMLQSTLLLALGTKGAFGKMVPILRQFVERNPDETLIRYQLALVLLLIGDREGYRRACAEAAEHFGASTDPTAFRVARAFSLTEDAAPFAPVALKLAEAGVNHSPKAGWTHYVLGLVHYRAGRFQEAVEQLNESLKVNPDWHAKALNWPLLALAHHRLGHAEEARKWLEKAHEMPVDAARGIPPEQRFGPETFWWDRAEFQLLLREADALILRRGT